MNNKTVILLTIVIAAVYFYSSYLMRKKGDSEEKESGAESPPVNTGETFSTFEGKGFNAVNREIERLTKDVNERAFVMTSLGLSDNILVNTKMSEEGKRRFNMHLSEQLPNYFTAFDLPIILSPNYLTMLEKAKGLDLNLSGRTPLRESITRMLQALNFNQVQGLRYSLFADDYQDLRINFLDSSKVYGDDKGKWENEKRNAKKFRDDYQDVIKNLKNIYVSFSDNVREIAVSNLEKKGWVFTDR